MAIYWFATKELRSGFSDIVMVAFIVWSFTFSIYTQAKGRAAMSTA